MQRGTVVGAIWSTRHIDRLPSGALLEIELDGGQGQLVAFDVLGTGIGERVIVVRGSVAAAWFESEPAPPIDALVVGSIDETEPVSASKTSKRSAPARSSTKSTS